MRGGDCSCRNCAKPYWAEKATADLKGYCTQRCMKAMAKACGWKESDKTKSPYTFLKAANRIGEIRL